MSKRALGVLVGVAGIAALLLGLQSVRWVIGTDYGIETHVGLRAMELCQDVQPEVDGPGEVVCSRVSHADIAKGPSRLPGFETFSLVSRITFFTALIAAGLVLLTILLALLNRHPSLGIAPSTLAILTSFVSIVLVVLTLAIHPWKEIGWGVGHAIYLAGGGASACLFASIVLGQLRPPVQDNW